MRTINNRDSGFLKELEELLTRDTFQYSDGTQGEFAEVQIGIQKRPAWFPFLSLHTAQTDFQVKTSGAGSGMRARDKLSHFLIEVRYECIDPEEGQARLMDLKWLVIELLAEHTSGKTYRYLSVDKAEHMIITPENPEQDLSWGFSGQILFSGTAEFTT